MMFLRLLCLAAGMAVLVAPPIVLFPVGAAAPDARFAAVFLACMALASCGLFLIGMAGHRLRRSMLLRSLAAVLLAAPCLLSAAELWRGGPPALLWMCSLLLAVSLLLYLSMAYRVVRVRAIGPCAGAKRAPALRVLPRG